MKKIAWWGVTLLLLFVCGLGYFRCPKDFARATSSDEEIILLGSDFGSTEESLSAHAITSSEVSQLTPVSENGAQKLTGYSYAPALQGENTQRHINASFFVDKRVENLDAKNYNLDEMELVFWARIDLKPGQVTRGLTVELMSDDETNKLSWVIGTSDFKSLVTRTSLSEMDKKIFGEDVSNATIGWVKFTLPVSVAQKTGEMVSGEKFTFNKITLVQTSSPAADLPINFYDIKLVKETADSVNRISAKVNDYCALILKPSAKVVTDDSKFYIGELFGPFMKTREVYSSLFVGDADYLDGTHSSDLKIMVDNGLIGSSANYYAYGSNTFKVNSHNYNISYGFFVEGRFVGVLSGNITATNYGKGAWFDVAETDFRVGETKKLNYEVHEAFKNATLTFSSTDEEVLKIIEINKTNQYVVVECVGKGSAGINILVADARLEGTEYEEDGLINDEFKIQVLKAEKNVDTTKVMLWIALGLLLGGLIYIAVKAIIDSKKIEVR